MRRLININNDWIFIRENLPPETAFAALGTPVDLPYTWNGEDGQDGGNNYYRDKCWFKKNFTLPEFNDDESVYLEFKGVNASCDIWLNGTEIGCHNGGYSTFRMDVSLLLEQNNTLFVRVDNSKSEHVYPQTADFTFYGGIYRDVNILIVNKKHFSLNEFGGNGIKLTPLIIENESNEIVTGKLLIETSVSQECDQKITVTDAEGREVYSGLNQSEILLTNINLWNGVLDPYLYTATLELIGNDTVFDKVSTQIGFRKFLIDNQKGFYLNNKSYPLRGVSRHQDRPKKGNAISIEDHAQDIALIKEVGANTVRLAHYQHADEFLDLCDKEGFVVWAEIPYISRHMSNEKANENAINQMNELIAQQYNHPCIMCWGVSNEINMYRSGKERLELNKKLNSLCHTLDQTRYTALANYAVCSNWNPLAHCTDITGFNLYYGWYVPFCFLTGKILDHYHKHWPETPVGLTEYGAEGMPNLHSKHPKRGDNSEEYQAIYHEKLLKVINNRPYLWGTYVWNMFDFAADARNQGGEPGMNHKGLVTFDRNIKKDAFYLYKAHWSKEPFIHICGKRFQNRMGNTIKIKVYSNQSAITLYNNGQQVYSKPCNKVVTFTLPFNAEMNIQADCGNISDAATFHKVTKADPAYILRKTTKNKSWQK